jgi:LysR family glycine cleavage system transcriptional activator
MAAAYDRLPLGALRVFEAVATSLNFSAAADALNVSPAAVSQQIKALEAYIQVPLFRRTGRRVELTDEALELLPAVRDGLERLESAMHQIKQHRRSGSLQISLLASFLEMWLLPRVRSFRRKFSDIDLRFHTSRELIDFSRTSTHVAIRFGHGNYPNLHSEKMLEEWLVPAPIISFARRLFSAYRKWRNFANGSLPPPAISRGRRPRANARERGRRFDSWPPPPRRL